VVRPFFEEPAFALADVRVAGALEDAIFDVDVFFTAVVLFFGVEVAVCGSANPAPNTITPNKKIPTRIVNEKGAWHLTPPLSFYAIEVC
jgi:hypothetical protein